MNQLFLLFDKDSNIKIQNQEQTLVSVKRVFSLYNNKDSNFKIQDQEQTQGS